MKIIAYLLLKSIFSCSATKTTKEETPGYADKVQTAKTSVIPCDEDWMCDLEDICAVDKCIKGYCVREYKTCSACGLAKDVKVVIKTDEYPLETFWGLINLDTLKEEMAGGPYKGDALETFGSVKCLDFGRYHFYIADSFGDGLCCEFGGGSYSLSIDGAEVVSGGDFQYTQDFYFNITECEKDDDCETEEHDSCTKAECHYGFCSSKYLTCNECHGSNDVRVVVNTDSFPSETTWKIFADNVVMTGGPYMRSFTKYEDTKCFQTGSFYMKVLDSYGDGIIEPGNYSVYVDNKLTILGSNFTASAAHSLDICKVIGDECLKKRECCSGKCRRFGRKKKCCLPTKEACKTNKDCCSRNCLDSLCHLK